MNHLIQTLTAKKNKPSVTTTDELPPGGLNMDEMLERLKLEVEEEKRRVYLERFGFVTPRPKEKEKLLRDFN